MRVKVGLKGSKIIYAAVAAAIIAAVAVVFYVAGFTMGVQEAYKRAREEVYMEAWGSSYMRGFSEGNRTGFEEGYKAGYNKGFADGYEKGAADAAGRSYTLRDPTFSELEEFLKNDETETLRWSPEGYSPVDLAAKLKENAAKAGLRCGLALVYHEAGLSILNCFNTVDKGIVYVEPWNDRTFTLKPGDYYVQWRVLKITIIW